MRLRRRSSPWFVLPAIVLAVAVLQSPTGAGAASAGGTIAGKASALGLKCQPKTTTDKAHFAYTMCSGEIPSFDGIGLDTDLSFPTGASAALPTLVMLHGWSNDKTEWESTTLAANGADKWHYNNAWFASHGWAVVNYTARGFKESCGTQDQDSNCSDGYTHLSDRHWETRDSQTLLGKLVDAGIANPGELASTGGSYGGGQTWLLVTSLPWKSPKGVTLHLAAGVAKYPWTDLLDSLTTSGRATSAVDQTRSHLHPLGIVKESYVDGLYAVGRATGQGRYDTNPNDPGTNLDIQYAFTSSGEPYDSKPNAQAIVDSYFSRSPYYANAYFSAVHAHKVHEVPVMSVQGWTDPLFPPVQTLQMFRKLKAADPNYPIQMVFGDVGHSNAKNPPAQWHPINTLANHFLAAHVLGHTALAPTAQAYSFRTFCPASKTKEVPVAGAWSGLAHGTASLVGAGSQQIAHAASSNPDDPAAAADGTASDPIANSGCLTEDDSNKDPAEAFWYWNVPANGMTLLGLPKVHLNYDLTGQNATVLFKLWDVAGNGSKVLVTRGDYRLSTTEGDPAKGTITTQLYGNDWFLATGHKLELQVSQTDAPYWRPDNEAFTLSLSGLNLTLPLQQAQTVTLTSAPLA